MSLFSFASRNYVKHALAWTCCIPCKLGRYISTFVTKIFAKYVCLKPRSSCFLSSYDHIFSDIKTRHKYTQFLALQNVSICFVNPDTFKILHTIWSFNKRGHQGVELHCRSLQDYTACVYLERFANFKTVYLKALLFY